MITWSAKKILIYKHILSNIDIIPFFWPQPMKQNTLNEDAVRMSVLVSQSFCRYKFARQSARLFGWNIYLICVCGHVQTTYKYRSPSVEVWRGPTGWSAVQSRGRWAALQLTMPGSASFGASTQLYELHLNLILQHLHLVWCWQESDFHLNSSDCVKEFGF